MASNQYDIGDVVRLSNIFRDTVPQDSDPNTIVVTLLKPGATSTTYSYAGATVTRDSLGHFHVDVDTTGFTPGRYVHRWVTTGTPKTASEGEFYIKPVGVTI